MVEKHISIYVKIQLPLNWSKQWFCQNYAKNLPLSAPQCGRTGGSYLKSPTLSTPATVKTSPQPQPWPCSHPYYHLWSCPSHWTRSHPNELYDPVWPGPAYCLLWLFSFLPSCQSMPESSEPLEAMTIEQVWMQALSLLQAVYQWW